MAAPIPRLLAASAWAASAMGLAIATYFTLVTYRIVPPDAAWIPRLCRMDEETCATVLRSRWARLLGVPNSVLGLGWYGLALGASTWALVWGVLPVCRLLSVLAAASVALSVVLAWSLLLRLRTHCRLCYTSHLLNAALLAMFASVCA